MKFDGTGRGPGVASAGAAADLQDQLDGQQLHDAECDGAARHEHAEQVPEARPDHGQVMPQAMIGKNSAKLRVRVRWLTAPLVSVAARFGMKGLRIGDSVSQAIGRP
ncbi:hypothetical protein ACJ51O_18910 [Burkholderia pyrrocinia]|uniref:hypothetical protein n=1 Tax=Burkholderia TaxID=32008 RepID=UPI001C301B47|nr:MULTISPECIES: hypothetical protein [Burkholderia]EKS9886890.1 hypothetical protein [Burkholderia pyrrocinia]EKS9895845.1 hypothetical protein [Burkholderia pyrrocinia]EKS9908518.1 hypothetical protein [Burkholderia pyrrocinia]UOB59395.1 hypothetical protein MRS60_21810 [Burkholderia pyrrocinia]